MPRIHLYDYQEDAIQRMHNGCILNGGVGSGKSYTSIAYYYKEMGGRLDYKNVNILNNPKDLYIITTARKRDTLEWEGEILKFSMSVYKEHNIQGNTVVVDSWNNIGKYTDIKDAFFIFDEQRVVGYGQWTKSFLKITKSNRWILLSATPGDTWSDYIPVFVANGYYKNKTDFTNQHVNWARWSNFPKIEGYRDTGRLVRYRNNLLVEMDFHRGTIPHHIDINCFYDLVQYKSVFKERWDPYDNKPIESASELCYLLRKIINSDPDRQVNYMNILLEHPKVIVFYNFDYELDILKSLDYGPEVTVAEWNGHKHQEIPDTDHWVYLVQYTAGCEGWNCIKTDTIIFYSQNYSYKVMAQAEGRIDRLNTPFIDLYYYHLKSKAGIDLAISKALANKKKFNEYKFAN